MVESGEDWRYTLTYQNLLFCRVPINSILGFTIRTYKKVGFGSLKHVQKFRALLANKAANQTLRGKFRRATGPYLGS